MTRWLEAVLRARAASDKTDITDNTGAEIAPDAFQHSEKKVLSVLSVVSGRDILGEDTTEPAAHLPHSDPDLYANALRRYGPMSYGMAMQRMGWGGTRAGEAESALRQAGRISFNEQGRAVLLEVAIASEVGVVPLGGTAEKARKSENSKIGEMTVRASEILLR
ncbi:hypothetical protein [Mesorhizobium sp. CA12]|uniref:hypothetical protein n=1 Tax=Mesorhizobium sp. CA12 TaxID=2876644 RepID=UPI001CCDE55C|nr:hypothetical protein [Mesorhizobium sp. CA12]MBZ9859720.1 hypothetical protein [Mesorhizobium sp. CA12]